VEESFARDNPEPQPVLNALCEEWYCEELAYNLQTSMGDNYDHCEPHLRRSVDAGRWLLRSLCWAAETLRHAGLPCVPYSEVAALGRLCGCQLDVIAWAERDEGTDHRAIAGARSAWTLARMAWRRRRIGSNPGPTPGMSNTLHARRSLQRLADALQDAGRIILPGQARSSPRLWYAVTARG
jgi:hypothetical protein